MMLQATVKSVEPKLSGNPVVAPVVQSTEKAQVNVPKTQQEKQDFNRFLEAYNDCV